MSLNFNLFEEVAMYKVQKTGEWVNRQWVETAGTPESFSGIWKHPRRDGANNTFTPEGVRVEDTIMVLTTEQLNTIEDIDYKLDVADTVYLEDPDANNQAIPYIVHSKKPLPPIGFKMIEADTTEYILCRRDRYKLPV